MAEPCDACGFPIDHFGLGKLCTRCQRAKDRRDGDALAMSMPVESTAGSTLDLPTGRDPVLHETLTAIMWVCLSIDAFGEGRQDFAKACVSLARESVMKTLQLANERTPT